MKWLQLRRKVRSDPAPPPASAQPAPPPPPSAPPPQRVLHVSLSTATAHHSKSPYPRNKIRTSKYTLLTFIPKNLFEQFRRAANTFFLVLALLPLVPDLQVASPGLAVVPIIFIITITAIKDGFEDWKRHQSDSAVNLSKTQILRKLDRTFTTVGRSSTRSMHADLPKPDGSLSSFVPPAGSILDSSNSLNTTANSSSDGSARAASAGGQNAMAALAAQPQANGVGNGSHTHPVVSAERKKADTAGENDHHHHPEHGNNHPNDHGHGDQIKSYADAEWAETLWKNVQVGEIIMIKNNQSIPADIIILSSSEPDCLCYVETKNLDGETNLKIRRGPLETHHLQSPQDCSRFVCTIKSEVASTNLYSYSGTLVLPPAIQEEYVIVPDGEGSYLPSPDVPASPVDGSLAAIAANSEQTIATASARNGYGGSNLKVDDHHDDDVVNVSGIDIYIQAADQAGPQSQQQKKVSMEEHASGMLNVEMKNGGIGSVRSMRSTGSRAKGLRSTNQNENGEISIPININGVLLRGCILRNTEWVIGIVIFTGPESKVMLNQGKTPSKRSRIEKRLNPQIFLNFVFLFFMCLFCAIANGIWWAYYLPNASGIFINDKGQSPGLVGFLTFWTCLILFQNVVPISLYISVEIVKTLQAYFIHQDINMYYAATDQPCVPRTWNISDDLGQIEYIFSDKTGTLTRNVMEFRRCSIAGVLYGYSWSRIVSQAAEFLDHEISEDLQNRLMKKEAEKMIKDMNAFFKNRYPSGNRTFMDGIIFSDLHAGKEKAANIREFFTMLAVCHTVLAERNADGDASRINYKAQSPDEEALVKGARDMGFAFLDRDQESVTISVFGESERFELLNIIEFNSDRKRMSVIVKRRDGRIILYCKGADSVIYERLAPRQDSMVEVTNGHLEEFAAEGLRTLCLSYRVLGEETYLTWARKYHQASIAIDQREKLMDEVAEEIETDLTLMGVTAIEDKLQEGVPECIATLSKAGIKIWVLTGDKMETAINIGFSCNLLTNDMTLITVKGTDRESTYNQLQEALDKLTDQNHLRAVAEGTGSPRRSLDRRSSQRRSSERRASNRHLPEHGAAHESEDHHHTEQRSTHAFDRKSTHSRHHEKIYSLIIDGHSLKYALEEPQRSLLLDLSLQMKSVVCCRVSPLQKAQVVQLIKDSKGAMTLAIGDGANDVSMIQAADVGVGISGLEGLQAVMSSDYAIAQFRFLTRLVLVHGHWSYTRAARMVLNFFYKNYIWVMVVWYFQFYSGWSSEVCYDFTYMMFYNLFFTSLPVIVQGIFDQDLRDDYLESVPQVYRISIESKVYSSKRFWLYILDGLYQSLVCWFIPYMAYGETSGLFSGYMGDLFEVGTVMAFCSAWNANHYLGMDCQSWTWMNHVVIWGSNILLILYTLAWGSIYGADIYLLYLEIFKEGRFYFCIILCTVLCMLPRYIVNYVYSQYIPNDIDLIREVRKYKLKDIDQELRVAGSPSIPHTMSHKKMGKNDDDLMENGTDVFEMINFTKNEARPAVRRPKVRLHRTMSLNLGSTAVSAAIDVEQNPSHGYAFSQDAGAASTVLSRGSESNLQSLLRESLRDRRNEVATNLAIGSNRAVDAEDAAEEKKAKFVSDGSGGGGGDDENDPQTKKISSEAMGLMGSSGVLLGTRPTVPGAHNLAKMSALSRNASIMREAAGGSGVLGSRSGGAAVVGGSGSPGAAGGLMDVNDIARLVALQRRFTAPNDRKKATEDLDLERYRNKSSFSSQTTHSLARVALRLRNLPSFEPGIKEDPNGSQ